jgi:uncharacterized DUF497 family protein
MGRSWDPDKDAINIKKHGISFDEAKTVLESDIQIILEDNRKYEQRFIAMGFSSCLNLLIVVYAFRREDLIRIISARKATKKERKTYEERIRF